MFGSLFESLFGFPHFAFFAGASIELPRLIWQLGGFSKKTGDVARGTPGIKPGCPHQIVVQETSLAGEPCQLAKAKRPIFLFILKDIPLVFAGRRCLLLP